MILTRAPALVRFTSHRFVAGAEFDRESKVCTRAAPILRRHIMGRHWRECAAWCAKAGVEWEVVA